MYMTLLITMLILQWNARSLIANGQEFKQYIYSQREQPDLLCIQQSWLKPNLDFIINGCVTFVKEGIPYRQVENKTDMEGVIIEVWVEVEN